MVSTESCIKSYGNNLMSLKIFYQKYYCSNYYDVSVNEYGVECGTSLGFWEIMDELIL